MVLMDEITLGERVMFSGWAVCFATLCWIVLRSAAPAKDPGEEDRTPETAG